MYWNDEIISRTTNFRNRLILELMASGGMRIGEVLKLWHVRIQDWFHRSTCDLLLEAVSL
jgi:site-specific recombinase XerD